MKLPSWTDLTQDEKQMLFNLFSSFHEIDDEPADEMLSKSWAMEAYTIIRLLIERRHK